MFPNYVSSKYDDSVSKSSPSKFDLNKATITVSHRFLDFTLQFALTMDHWYLYYWKAKVDTVCA